jgi:hypothetical protein
VKAATTSSCRPETRHGGFALRGNITYTPELQVYPFMSFTK